MYIERLIKDQPMAGLEKVIWWTEYAIRNQGALHLRNPRANMSWSEFLMLDVALFLFSILIIALFAVYKISHYTIFRLFLHIRKQSKNFSEMIEHPIISIY